MKLKFSFDEVYLASDPIDFRFGINSLSALVSDQFGINPANKSLYIFTNRGKNRIKCLYYDGTGFWLLYKILNEGKFRWTVRDDGLVSISRIQLDWLLTGLNLENGTNFREYVPLYV